MPFLSDSYTLNLITKNSEIYVNSSLRSC